MSFIFQTNDWSAFDDRMIDVMSILNSYIYRQNPVKAIKERCILDRVRVPDEDGIYYWRMFMYRETAPGEIEGYFIIADPYSNAIREHLIKGQ